MAILYIHYTCISISLQKASLSPFFAFRIKNSFIIISILLLQTGLQEMLCESFVYVLLFIRRAKDSVGCILMQKISRDNVFRELVTISYSYAFFFIPHCIACVGHAFLHLPHRIHSVLLQFSTGLTSI